MCIRDRYNGLLCAGGECDTLKGFEFLYRTRERGNGVMRVESVSYTHLRAHETVLDIVCRLLLEKKKYNKKQKRKKQENGIITDSYKRNICTISH